MIKHRLADMEVAGQWRREWAGTAEYGKVTEGGVTRRVARAMEVLHASAPGARVRVVRAAYHSSAGPGAPTASCLMHSSRRVISSGFNLLESPSFPSKPMEISSTPLESSPESNIDTENYEVTEPDDFDISEPSKWRSSTAGSAVRMPSEESSSTDNASIIDLDARPSHKGAFRKYSNDSENSDIPINRRNGARVSPLLDAPVALSTLKYKSLLNGSNDWNNRRKSYSFEDTSPLSESIVHNNDTLAMESSTDSGICKSTEIVNNTDDKEFDKKDRKQVKPEETFQEWLSKNRSNSFYTGNHFSSYRNHDVVVEHPLENNIALQSRGKVSITVPITLETDDEYKQNNGSDDGDRKIKKVEFCKTELHFAAESGKVNIIATDEKPPPSNDFRKRRSAFVPIHKNFDKPITLFGETNDIAEIRNVEFPTYPNNELGDLDENTAATKSILKNKIPKPKPYLLGENMVLGITDNLVNSPERLNCESSVPTAVTLINKQLQSERRYSDESICSFPRPKDMDVIKTNTFRTANKGPAFNDSTKSRQNIYTISTSSNFMQTKTSDSVKNKLKSLQMSPIPGRARTRQLRDSDLTYFGIDKVPKVNNEVNPIYESSFQVNNRETGDILESVRLIQQVSNSICNSEAESDDSPEYQNIPIKVNFAPVPIPKSRSKFDSKTNEMRILKPVIEQESEINKSDSRRSRLKKQEVTSTVSSRSLSEPPKTRKHNSIEKYTRRPENHQTQIAEVSLSQRSNKNLIMLEQNKKRATITTSNSSAKNDAEESDPLYVNLYVQEIEKRQRNDSTQRKSELERKCNNKETNINRNVHKKENIKSHGSSRKDNPNKHNTIQVSQTNIEDNIENSLQKIHHNQRKDKRMEKLTTPENLDDKRTSNKILRPRKAFEKSNENKSSYKIKAECGRGSSSQQSTSPSPEHRLLISENANRTGDKSVSKQTSNKNEQEDKTRRARKSSKDKTNSRKEYSQAQHKLDTSTNNSYGKSTKPKIKELNITEKSSSVKSDNYKTSNKSEYVINYDDKNGTVSSICKVKLGPGSSKRQKILKESTKDGSKENKTYYKTTEKNALRK